MSWFNAPCQGFGHAGRVFGLAYHPFSSDVIASASEDETVRVWRRCQASASWEQTSCCRGHEAEVLRVAWSPDGQFLASGSADHTVRVWQVGINEQESYSGIELAALNGHPEEVYGVKFITSSASHNQLQPLEQQQNDSPSSSTNMLLAASGEFLFLWDLQAGRVVAQSAPPPTAAMAKLSMASGVNGSGPGRTASPRSPAADAVPAAASAAASAAVDAPTADGGDNDSSQVNDAAGESDSYDDGVTPSYIFSLAVAEGTSWLAGSCSDGMLRLWDGSNNSLAEFAAVQVHGGDMGSCCSFLPGQPWLVQSISKRGQLVLLDMRMLAAGRGAVLMQELEGPVFDSCWVIRQPPPPAAAAATAATVGSTAAEIVSSRPAAANSAASSSDALQLWLAVVGCDHCVRSYQFSNEAISHGRLGPPEVLPMASSYHGRLLAVAAPLDYSSLAVAGEAVQADTLKPWRPCPQQQQQQLLQRSSSAGLQQQQQQAPDIDKRISEPGVAVAEHAAAATAAAAAAARRPRGGRRSTSRKSIVNILDFKDDEGDEEGQQIQQQEQQEQQQQQQQQNERAQAAHSTNMLQTGETPPAGPDLPGSLSVADADQQQAAAQLTASAGVQQHEVHQTAAEAALVAEVTLQDQEPPMTSCAAMSDVLLRAPLFTWLCH